jgi:hypothetical protein
VLRDTEILAKCTLAKVGKSSQWTTIVNSAENRRNFGKFLDGKPLFSTLYSMYTITLKELKAVLKVNAQAGQNGAVNKTSSKPMVQDGKFWEEMQKA